jgi:hypothetical protein
MTYNFKNLLADCILYTVANKIVALAFYHRRIQSMHKANQDSFWLSVELDHFFWTYLFANFIEILFFKMENQVLLFFIAVKRGWKQIRLFEVNNLKKLKILIFLKGLEAFSGFEPLIKHNEVLGNLGHRLCLIKTDIISNFFL